MNINVGAYTAQGIIKELNQDAFSFKVANTSSGKMAFAIVCDGMGGLEKGELASEEVVLSFDEWFWTELPAIVSNRRFSKEQLYHQWNKRIKRVEQKMRSYGKEQNIEMGTTLSGLFIFEDQYYICHVGDSRIYCIDEEVQLLTTDHTLIARELALGRITEDKARSDVRRNVLLQCVGTVNASKPEFLSGRIDKNTTFLMCSDGFVHRLSEQEIQENFLPKGLLKKGDVEETCKRLTHLAMERGEKDNITVIGVVVTG